MIPRKWGGAAVWRDGLLALVALVALLVCTYYFFWYAVLAPYPWLDFDSSWTVARIDGRCSADPELCFVEGPAIQRGDRIVEIGAVDGPPLTLDQFRANRLLVPFRGYHEGDVVPVTFERESGGELRVFRTHVRLANLSLSERLWQMLGMSFMIPFWLAGSIVLLFLRPRDERWTLMVATNYLTALWISAGILSPTQIAGSSVVMHAASWLMVPTFLHLHLVVPAPLGSARRRFRLEVATYALATVAAAAELLQLLPVSAFYVALLFAIGSSLAILLYRSLAHPAAAHRLSTRLMLMGVGLGFGPGLLVWVGPTLLRIPVSSNTIIAVTTAGLPLWPLFYLYVVYKQQMGNLELRANRLLSLYSFILLFSIGFLVTFLAGSKWANLSPQVLPFALILSSVFIFMALWLRPGFQRLFDRLAYGTEHNPDTIIRTFANQIPRALDREALARLLTSEVSPALLVRQSALYSITGETAPVVYAHGVAPYTGVDLPEQLHNLLDKSGHYLPPGSNQAAVGPFDWVRLAIPIEVGGKRIAVWLLGKRDPDDFYPQLDIELLTTLGNQVGVALETARLIESLQRRASELETAYRDLQRLDQLKDEFVQNVSHELRTPLTFLRGYADLLLEELLGPVNPQQRDALQTMSDRTEGIIRLVNDIISVQQARAESPVQELVNLPALARSCLEAAEVAARKQDAAAPVHSFRLEVADNIPPIVGDRRRLSQVIDNLLGNAIKFSPQGGCVSIRIAPCTDHRPGAAPDSASPLAVAIEISDQGIGIPPGEIERIWQRFYQVDGSSTRRFGGMGLGLAIVRGIVESQGGHISVESQVDRGSTFRVVLPATPPVRVAAGLRMKDEG